MHRVVKWRNLLCKIVRRASASVAVLATIAYATTTAGAFMGSRAAATTPPIGVTVRGNQLVNSSGAAIRVLGVDRSGTEYACAEGWGSFDGPSDATSVAAIAFWHVNAVRVPLNEDCWLGINGVNPNYSGVAYQNAIKGYVSELNQAGLIAILDLHWSAPGTTLASGQQVMADADHSPAMWSSVASAFRSVAGVMFDLYNEPHDISWSCWLNGCITSGGWQAAGMQSLLNAVRASGDTQPVLVGGLNWAGDLSGWLAHEPVDPAHQLVASAHIYNFSQCATPACWDATIAPVAAAVPVVTGEIGENDCSPAFIDSYMAWADAHGVSYLGWSWNTANCSGGPALITSYSGSPTAFGAGLQSHLGALVAQPSPGGQYVLDGSGHLDPVATAGAPTPAATSESWATSAGLARVAVSRLDDTGGYVLDGYGSLHPFSIGSNTMPPAAATSASWPGWDIARSVALLPSGAGGYVLDGWGGVHPFTTAANPMPAAVSPSTSWPEQDVARGLAFNSAGTIGGAASTTGQVSAFGLGTASGSTGPSTGSAVLTPGTTGRGLMSTW